MAKKPEFTASLQDVILLTLFAQRSPNLEFREAAVAIALAALKSGSPSLDTLRPLCQFAARTEAKSPSAQRARELALRLLREGGHAELWTQLAGSTKTR